MQQEYSSAIFREVGPGWWKKGCTYQSDTINERLSAEVQSMRVVTRRPLALN